MPERSFHYTLDKKIEGNTICLINTWCCWYNHIFLWFTANARIRRRGVMLVALEESELVPTLTGSWCVPALTGWLHHRPGHRRDTHTPTLRHRVYLNCYSSSVLYYDDKRKTLFHTHRKHPASSSILVLPLYHGQRDLQLYFIKHS